MLTDLFYLGDGTLVLDHESVVFAGDLNYRIDGLERDVVIQATIDENWPLLLDYDQLSLQLRTNPYFALSDFKEGPISFAPTFKFDVGTDLYDSSDKKRVPAYCDRVFELDFTDLRDIQILFRGRIRLLRYQRGNSTMSDHKPVCAVMDVTTRQVDWTRYKEIKNSILVLEEYVFPAIGKFYHKKERDQSL